MDCKHNSLLGWFGGLFLCWGKSKHKITTDELKKADYKTSTQSLGMSFTEHLRDVFRFRWIRRK